MDLHTEVAVAMLTDRFRESKHHPARRAFASHQKQSNNLVQAVVRLVYRLKK